MATSSCSSSLALLLVMVYAASGAFAATTHVVGDNQQWTIPQNQNAYTDWASKQTFTVGDSLVFRFATGSHDVLEVTKSNYDACNKQSPIASHNNGPATVNLSTSGTQYYICGVPTHCSLGQKMTLTVSAAASSPTSPSPPPTAGGPTTPPASATPPPTSSTPTVPSSPGPSSPGTPPSPSAAPSKGLQKAAIVAVVLTASVAALVL